MCCLCVNMYCITANGFQSNCSQQIYIYIYIYISRPCFRPVVYTSSSLAILRNSLISLLIFNLTPFGFLSVYIEESFWKCHFYARLWIEACFFRKAAGTYNKVQVCAHERATFHKPTDSRFYRKQK